MIINHPNIIRLLDFQIDMKKGRTYLVLEYAENGNLFSYMKANRENKMPNINQIFKSVCQAVNYLHSQNIMHRDIKVFFILFSLKIYYLTEIILSRFVPLASQHLLRIVLHFRPQKSIQHLKLFKEKQFILIKLMFGL
jgi:serine/threonine protein kinase